jgi:hypothetical protein
MADFSQRQPAGSSLAECASIVLGFGLLTVALTYPLAFQLGTSGYKIHAVGDAQYAVWNVAWVAHALLTDPRQVFDANIFYPHRGTLTYSEANLVAGALATPVYWITGGNAYAAHNFVVLLSFVLSATSTYYLAKYLVSDRRAAVIAAISFAYCPYVFSRLAQIQLLMTAGLPLSLLAFHRLADRPTLWRGLLLGTTMGLQALACAYYGVFLAMLMGPAVLLTASSQRLWRNYRYWGAVTVAALVATAIVMPLFARYLALQSESGFGRPLDEARAFSATWRTYLVSGAYASSWMEDTDRPTKVLFPGIIASVLGIVGLCMGCRLRERPRQIGLLYGSLALLAAWLSLGPDGGLYRLMYVANPAFTFMRAPGRFGVVVTLALSVLASLAISVVLRRTTSIPALVAAGLGLIAVAEHASPLQFTRVPDIAPVYRVLAEQPFGAVLELPMYSPRFNFSRTQYMLSSTAHWKPLVNGYSDFIPREASLNVPVLADFPTAAAFETLPTGVRYAVFHLNAYRGKQREALVTRLQAFAPRLRRIYADDLVWLYELVTPPADTLRPVGP